MCSNFEIRGIHSSLQRQQTWIFVSFLIQRIMISLFSVCYIGEIWWKVIFQLRSFTRNRRICSDCDEESSEYVAQVYMYISHREIIFYNHTYRIGDHMSISNLNLNCIPDSIESYWLCSSCSCISMSQHKQIPANDWTICQFIESHESQNTTENVIVCSINCCCCSVFFSSCLQRIKSTLLPHIIASVNVVW